MEAFECKICHNTSANLPFKVKEMMFGLRHEFLYLQCAKCGCLQLQQIPNNISDYYPKEAYYSFATSSLSSFQKSIKDYLLGKLFNYYIGNFSIIGYFTSKSYYLHKRYEWIRCLAGIDKSARILDIGSGAGKYLDELYTCGFKNIKGMDPYIEKDIVTHHGIQITQQNINDIKGNYDLIMLNHVFEHLEHPMEILSQLKTLLNKSGKILIRIPLVDSYAWEKYGVHWYQIDAPRHFYLHTKKSMELLTNKTGFKIHKIIYDANDYQFIFSEQYLQNKNIKAPLLFNKKQIKHWRKQAAQLNNIEQGDQACFILIPNQHHE